MTADWAVPGGATSDSCAASMARFLLRCQRMRKSRKKARSARPATPPTTLPTTVGVGGVLLPVSLPLPDAPPVVEVPLALPVAVPAPTPPIPPAPVPVELLRTSEERVAETDDESVGVVEKVLVND